MPVAFSSDREVAAYGCSADAPSAAELDRFSFWAIQLTVQLSVSRYNDEVGAACNEVVGAACNEVVGAACNEVVGAACNEVVGLAGAAE